MRAAAALTATALADVTAKAVGEVSAVPLTLTHRWDGSEEAIVRRGASHSAQGCQP